MAGERYKHIFLPGPSARQGFTNPRHGGSQPRLPNRNRRNHGAALRRSFEQAWPEQEAAEHGVKLEFESEPGFDLVFKSLENLKSGIRLLNVRREGEGHHERIFATVFVPASKRGFFLKKISAYAQGIDRGTKKLVESISNIRRAVLESFWTDERGLIPGNDAAWIEVWLSSDDEQVLNDFGVKLNELEIAAGQDVLKFPERSVRLIRSNRHQLERLIEESDNVAELRAAKELATFFIKLENRDQVAKVRELLNRTRFSQNPEVAVCILDHGVNNGHLLIQPVLHDTDRHAVVPDWGVHDDDGHGTLMAGTVAYGDMLDLLNSNQRVYVQHCLESAKILPPPPAQNEKRLWGSMTAQGISRAEIQAPRRKRTICMALTSNDDRDRGRPSSWSAKLDELASGYEDDIRRLIIVSAGNVDDPENWKNYLTDNQTNEVHDPGQSWNSLTVGAFTEKIHIQDQQLQDYVPIAPVGGLSPFSTTSTTWPSRKWPIKPEVVFEGGNVARGPNDSIFDTEDLKLLSTSHEPQVSQFAPFFATSAAAAQASWMAAQIQVLYPDAWPETVRGLIVHTAEWTEAMKQQFLHNPPSKTDYARLLRIAGYGVPSLERTLYCATNSLTLISQAELQPFDKITKEYNGKPQTRFITRDMHLYRLPWPADVLLDLGEQRVTMRVTLSYFVEPGPGERGWDNRYRYASHGLRFSLNGPREPESDFISRVNDQARDEEEGHPRTEGPEWTLGECRNVGSIHSDIWQKGTAADLATSNLIAIYPAVGWWRERHHLNRWNKQTRYSLIISIRTEEQDIDIYTPVATKIGISVPVAI